MNTSDTTAVQREAILEIAAEFGIRFTAGEGPVTYEFDEESVIRFVEALPKNALAAGAAVQEPINTPTERGVYAWVSEGSSATVLVHTRPSDHSPGGVMKGSVIRPSTFYDGCPVEQWIGGAWFGPLSTKNRLAAPVPSQAASVDGSSLSIMRTAFRVTESQGHPDPAKQRFHMRFTFRSMDEMHAADNQWHSFVKSTQAAATVALTWAHGVEAVAAMLEKKADDYAREYGSDDLGSLSFGQGAHAEAKRDYHSSLIELAEEVRALLAAPAADSQGLANISKEWCVNMAKLEPAEGFPSAAATGECDVPPNGWRCSREKGHEGPCAASRIDAADSQDERKYTQDDMERYGKCYADARDERRLVDSQDERAALPAWFDAFLTNVCEIPDRNSPDDEPEAIIATIEELKSCALNAIENMEPSTGICFFCGEPVDGEHEQDCPQAEARAASPADTRKGGDEELIAAIKAFAAKQKPLGAAETKVLYDNLWDLYASDGSAEQSTGEAEK